MADVFHIDDLLDFSNEDIAGPIVGGPMPSSQPQQQLSGLTVESSEPSICCSSSLEEEATVEDVVDDKPDLCVPCDDLADLEWLSSFVEDSFTMGDTQPLYTCEETCFGVTAAETPTTTPTPTTSCVIEMANSMTKAFDKGDKEEEEEDDLYHKSSPVSVLENSATSSELTTSHDCGYSVVPGRARSKRSRTGARIWTSRILSASSSVTSFESMMGPESSYASMSFSPSPGASGDSNSGLDDQDGEENSQSSKRCKTTHNNHQSSHHQSSHHQNASNSSSKSKKKNQDITQPWRCMHCQTQRTPQWRTGPMGPKTLCNACGVRFKSGRLLPEYRPAGSPTYVAAKHSHSHKKVLEMRRDREMMRQQSSPVPSPPSSSHNMQTHQTHIPPQQQQQQHQHQHQHHQHQCGGVGNAAVEFSSLDLQNCFSKPTDLLPNFAGVDFAQNRFGVEEEHSINRDRVNL